MQARPECPQRSAGEPSFALTGHVRPSPVENQRSGDHAALRTGPPADPSRIRPTRPERCALDVVVTVVGALGVYAGGDAGPVSRCTTLTPRAYRPPPAARR